MGDKQCDDPRLSDDGDTGHGNINSSSTSLGLPTVLEGANLLQGMELLRHHLGSGAEWCMDSQPSHVLIPVREPSAVHTPADSSIFNAPFGAQALGVQGRKVDFVGHVQWVTLFSGGESQEEQRPLRGPSERRSRVRRLGNSSECCDSGGCIGECDLSQGDEAGDCDVVERAGRMSPETRRCDGMPADAYVGSDCVSIPASHSGLSGDGSASKRCQPGASINLHQALPLPNTGGHAELKTLVDRIALPWLDFWTWDADMIEMPNVLRQHLAASPPLEGMPLAFCVFADGSALPVGAGWGLNLNVWNGESWTCVGWAGGLPLGAGPDTNAKAECSALLAAITWAFSVPLHIPVEVVVDSTFARDCACGNVAGAADLDSKAPAVIVRQLMQLHERIGRQLLINWTPSHVGTFGNEFADAVAKTCARRKWCASAVPRAATDLWDHPLLPWAWLLRQRLA